MNPADAAARGITDRSVVRLFTDRGSCLAGITLTEDVRPGVVQLSTGAWYDPDPADRPSAAHGNPNVLSADRPSSALSQGNTGQLTMVEIEPYDAVPPEVSVHRLPATEIKDVSWEARGSGRYSHDGVSLRLGSFGSGVASMLRAALFSLILIRLIALSSMPGWPLKACWSAVSICR